MCDVESASILAFIGILGMGIVPTITDMDFQIKNQMIFVPEEKGNAMPDCDNCIEKCPKAETAHEIALGRMYATKELVKLIKKIESGQMVEVVRCKDCVIHGNCDTEGVFYFCGISNPFCCAGRRKRNG